MPLNKQIHIYSLDTGDFYTDEEQIINRHLSRYRKYSYILSLANSVEYTDIQKEKYRRLNSYVTSMITNTKNQLKDSFKANSEIRVLKQDRLTDKKIISVFESTLTRVLNIEIDSLNTDIMVVQTYFYDVIEQMIKDGFIYNNEHYQYFTSSAGQIRTKKTVFIKLNIWQKISKTIMCGLTIDHINLLGGINVNKYLAYLALSNSATDLWEDFNIDKCIVVNDFETNVLGEVDFISDVTYEIERKTMHVPITHTDGCGMILPLLSKKNFMVRMPWVKGLLASFDFRKFIKKNQCSSVVTDIYGKQWDIEKDDIQIIFTESQFKMAKYYKSWKQYQDYFKQYNCQAGICNMEEDYFSDATINYQMIQTLTDITENEIECMLQPSKNILHNMSRDKNTMLQVFGVTKSNTNKTYLQQALEIYPELLQDEYCKNVLRQIKNSLIKDYRSAKININGKYTFLVPDLYAFCEHLFCKIENPKGLLADGQVSCRLFIHSDKLDCLRSPHLYREHAVRDNIINQDTRNWFCTKAIYTSSHDLISKILQFDNDGDKSLVVADPMFVSVAERNMKNDNIVPLYYEMKKAQPVILNSVSIYNGLNAAYTGGNIGIYSNNISKIWNGTNWAEIPKSQKLEALKVIKLLCMENNFVIDYAKTLYKPTRPKEIEDLIKKYINNKLPHFFIYAKDKTDNQVTPVNDFCIVDSFEKRIKKKPLRYTVSDFGKFNYRALMKTKYIKLDDRVIQAFVKLNKEYHFKIDQKNKENVEFIIKTVRDSLLNLGYSESDLVDMLTKYLYSVKKTPFKELLWKCFGKTLVFNLKNSIPSNSIPCNYCGKRIIPVTNNQKYCKNCATIVRNEQKRRSRGTFRKHCKP